MAATIADFGLDANGYRQYRINGTKQEIEEAIEEIKKFGKLSSEPVEIEKTYKTHSVLIKVMYETSWMDIWRRNYE